MKYITRLKIAWANTTIVNKLSFFLTLVIAGANIAYVCYARKQFITMSGQLGEMQSSSKQTDQLIGLYRQQVGEVRRQASDTHELAVQAKNQADAVRGQLPALKLAAKASQNAANIASDTLQISQGAYVSMGRKDGVIAEFRKSKDPKLRDGMVIYFQNSGHLPAKFNWGLSNWFTRSPLIVLPGAKPFAPMMKTRDKKTGAVEETGSTDGNIGGDSIREVAVGSLPPSFVDSLFNENKLFEVNGTYEYCDELGTYSCKLFALAYQHSPYGSFRVLSEYDCPDRSFLGNTNPGPDKEELPLCSRRKAPRFPNR